MTLSVSRNSSPALVLVVPMGTLQGELTEPHGGGMRPWMTQLQGSLESWHTGTRSKVTTLQNQRYSSVSSPRVAYGRALH